jgi:cardiolipin synthase
MSKPSSRWLGGNHLTLLRGGEALFPAMEAAFAEARSSIFLETYIFHDDAAAQRVADVLVEAAARGVRVHVLIDGFGSAGTLGTLAQRFMGTGVDMYVFRPVSAPWRDFFRPSRWRRLHRKLCVVDARVGFVGGINLLHDQLDIHHGWSEAPRLDYAVRVEGPLVPASLAPAAQRLWVQAELRRSLSQGGWRDEVRALAQGTPGHERRAYLRDLLDRARGIDAQQQMPPAALASADLGAPMRAALVVRDNFRDRRTIERAYIAAILSARQSIKIITPYFYPGRLLRQALRRAARRGVAITLVMQGRFDYKAAEWAAKAVYDELQATGIRIVEYTPAFLHAKVAVVDAQGRSPWATVGSSNIDPLSLLLNREANVIVRDGPFAQVLEAEIDQAIAASREVPPLQHTSPLRRWLHKGAVAAAARLLMWWTGLTGRY